MELKALPKEIGRRLLFVPGIVTEQSMMEKDDEGKCVLHLMAKYHQENVLQMIGSVFGEREKCGFQGPKVAKNWKKIPDCKPLIGWIVSPGSKNEQLDGTIPNWN